MRKELRHKMMRLMSFNTIRQISPLGGWGTLFLLLLFACTPSSDIEEEEAFYMQTMATLVDETAEKKMTRAHWNNAGKFLWDNSNGKMVVFVKKSADGEFILWGTNKYSFAKVAKMDNEDATYASITSNSGILKTDIRKITVGQTPVYFFSPVAKADVSSEGVVNFTLPGVFEQPASHSLADFADYTYIMAESTVSEVSNVTILATPTQFTGIPAVIRFSVSNDRYTNITVKSIKITPNNGFHQSLSFTPGNPISTPSESKLTDVKANIENGAGEEFGIRNTENATKDYFVFIFPTSFTTATLTLEGVDSEDRDFTYTCDISDKTFEGNHIYTWNIKVADNFMSLSFNENETGIFQW